MRSSAPQRAQDVEAPASAEKRGRDPGAGARDSRAADTTPERRPAPSTPPLRVYVAAPLAHAVLACFVADELSRLGHAIVSRWHRRVVGASNVLVAAERDAEAVTIGVSAPNERSARLDALNGNLLDLDEAEAVVALAHVGEPRATIAEIGYILGFGSLREEGPTVVWVQGTDGRGRNLFDAHQYVRRVVVGAGRPNLVEQVAEALVAPVWRSP